MENSCEKKSPSSSPSPSLFDSLTDALVLRILCRLPRLSSYSSRYVCKRWLALISSSRFDRESRKLHKNRYNPFVILRGCKRNTRESEELLMFGYDDSGNLAFKTPASTLSFLPNYEEGKTIEVMGFNKQLLLCRIESIYYICCPVTREWVSIPPEPYCFPLVRFGFIFDSFNGYIVLRVPVRDGRSASGVIMYSSTTGKWSRPLSFRGRTNLNVVTYDGMVVWWSGDFPRGLVMYDPYDVENPKKVDTPAPPNTVYDDKSPYRAQLGVCRGSLRLCEIYRKDVPTPESLRPKRLMVWRLKDPYGQEKWILEHNINFKELVKNQEGIYTCEVLAFDPNDEDILYLIRNRTHSEVVSCNLRMKTIDVIESEEFERFAIHTYL